MKNRRHLKIMNYIQEEEISTQSELARKLRADGIDVTQATVSRDIKQLGLIKVPTNDQGYKYALPPEQKQGNLKGRMERMFKDSIVEMGYSENLIVITTLPGAAQGVASLLDKVDWDGILGTVAGDDTILIIAKPKEAVSDIMDKLHDLTI
ncbi:MULTISPECIES: arginine repressor [unclassified Candidatus Frackibacter]|uniref:arginine repressor n=1 Tax=unclassified Candidatus Frackibacter TaxID=2648818 RepID=UPI00087E4D70|nr:MULTISPECIES: arginine repressor [unclassified Candidatus Frackibacter]SDC02609.1 transcriptional regulator, ArgR family [Candidatus Frackibacter sp. WG11]SEM69676.1 transcriptional regulator, ArgR family [Candidatus Frackibacter sp. WG12]SFL80921.1 transcriptional regulator, ArgR family [Candidatus Frackibacter sp. WG13]